MIGEAEVEVAAVQAAAAVPSAVGIDAAQEAIMTLDEELPSDDEEFAAPPPDETNMPIQPSQFEAEALPA
jgi:hypothetical protein